jgi:hypothetical protein
VLWGAGALGDWAWRYSAHAYQMGVFMQPTQKGVTHPDLRQQPMSYRIDGVLFVVDASRHFVDASRQQKKRLFEFSGPFGPQTTTSRCGAAAGPDQGVPQLQWASFPKCCPKRTTCEQGGRFNACNAIVSWSHVLNAFGGAPRAKGCFLHGRKTSRV